MVPLQELPSSVRYCALDGRDVYLVGTAHVSAQSVQDVGETIGKIQPDTICIELCPSRYQSLNQQDAWKNMDLFEVVRKGKSLYLLGHLIMSGFYQRIGQQLGVKPGAEMLEGARLAKELNAELVLADRSVEVTIKRVWRSLNFWDQMKAMAHLLSGFFLAEEIDQKSIEELKNPENLENTLQEFAKEFPQAKEKIIDERDWYLAEKIRTAPGKKIVAVVGAGHVPGILNNVHREISLKTLEEVPPPSQWPKVFKWAFSLLLVGLVLYGFFAGASEKSLQSIYLWAASHAVLAGAGTALAFGHPLAILASSIAAPFTSLNPMIAAGWIAGLVQAWVKRPTVADLENVPAAITSLKGFWTNPVTRVLLVVILANLGSSLGTFITSAWILSHSI
ncbi:hypothetical protein PARA125_000433 [Parachlamydia sp. AcF125]|nr:hypothetical protein [Parachlamydia sp. AcF125]